MCASARLWITARVSRTLVHKRVTMANQYDAKTLNVLKQTVAIEPAEIIASEFLSTLPTFYDKIVPFSVHWSMLLFLYIYSYNDV